MHYNTVFPIQHYIIHYLFYKAKLPIKLQYPQKLYGTVQKPGLKHFIRFPTLRTYLALKLI